METKDLGAAYDLLAPDHSEIRRLLALRGGSAVHVTLPAGGVSLAVTHRTVEEIWYVLSGTGQVWRRQEDAQQEVAVSRGVCLTIPVGTHFQFRATGDQPLAFLCLTMPPWPGPDEAMRVPDHWPV